MLTRTFTEKTVTTTYIEKSLLKKLKALLLKEERSFSHWVNEQAEKYIKDNK